mgnify:FL=1
MLELAEGSLADWILQTQPGENSRSRWQLACQIVHGVASLHDRCVLHLDLKPGNILTVTQQAGTCAKISDFGLSQKLGKNKCVVIQGDMAYTRGYRPHEAVMGGSSQAGLHLRV